MTTEIKGIAPIPGSPWVDTRPTPETDAFFSSPTRAGFSALADFARKLERERDDFKLFYQNTREQFDETIRKLETYRELCIRYEAERDEARLHRDIFNKNWGQTIIERDQLRADIETMEIRHAAVMLHTQSVVDENTQLRKVCDELVRTLGFFASVIKSGEPWTTTCQQEYDKALAAYNELKGKE